ncbi:MAG TPA: AAA family ATPase [Caulobacterales bacterium]|nr:AAA family ATPase [Caulobacterales bacterium]
MAKLIAITGGSGAGKTTIANALMRRLAPNAVIIGEDDYYRCSSTIPDFDAASFNFDEPAAKDDALLAQHLARARRGEGFDKPRYDLSTHRRERAAERVTPPAFVIVEGIHLLAFPDLRNLFDLAVYIEAEEALRLGRRMIRDVETRARTPHSVFHQFFTYVRPMHDLHVAPQRSLADLVLVSSPEGGPGEAEAHATVIEARLQALS